MLKRIRLELARDAEFPKGSARHGYEFVAPLREDGHIDTDRFASVKDRCRVVRFWGDEEHETGHLVRRGASGFAFHYKEAGDVHVEDEAGYRFTSHSFRPGEYVSIKEDDDELRTFRVARVVDA